MQMQKNHSLFLQCQFWATVENMLYFVEEVPLCSYKRLIVTQNKWIHIKKLWIPKHEYYIRFDPLWIPNAVPLRTVQFYVVNNN